MLQRTKLNVVVFVLPGMKNKLCGGMFTDSVEDVLFP